MDMSSHSHSMSSMSGSSTTNSSMTSTSHSEMTMNTYFVAGQPNVPLWFSGWTPTNAGGAFGACVGLFALTVFTKLLGALRHRTHMAWAASKWHDSGMSVPTLKHDTEAQSPLVSLRKPSVPWKPSREIPRGILAAIHVGLDFFLMLAVMTYNVYYFISIIFGHFVGEVLFGRYAAVALDCGRD